MKKKMRDEEIMDKMIENIFASLNEEEETDQEETVVDFDSKLLYSADNVIEYISYKLRQLENSESDYVFEDYLDNIVREFKSRVPAIAMAHTKEVVTQINPVKVGMLIGGTGGYEYEVLSNDLSGKKKIYKEDEE